MSETPLESRAGLAVPWLITLVFGVFPWLGMLRHVPRGTDAMVWVSETSPANPDWMNWVFHHRHFVGYRPVTAMSFTANHWLTGWEPYGFRLTDMGIHAAAGAAVFALFRRLTDDARWAALAAVLFLYHPAAQTVVPYVARRSYSLSVALGCAGLALLVMAFRAGESAVGWRVLGGSLALLGAVLSNEVGFVLLPLVPMLAWTLSPPGQRFGIRIGRASPALAALVTALLLRFSVMGFGGYGRVRVATDAGARADGTELENPLGQVLLESWSNLLLPGSPLGDPTWVEVLVPGAIWIGAAVAVLWVGRIAADLARNPTDEVNRLRGILIVWILGYSLLYTLSGTWFWRMTYPMVVPLALLSTFDLREAWTGSSVRRILLLVPSSFVLLTAIPHTPLVGGMNEDVLKGQRRITQLVDHAAVYLDRHVDGPALIWVSAPVRGPNAATVVFWLRRRLGDRSLNVRLLAVARSEETLKVRDSMVDVRTLDDGELAIRPANHALWSDDFAQRQQIRRTEKVPLYALHHGSPDTPTWVYRRTVQGTELLAVPVPPH